MALVAYDASDSSEFEDEESETPTVVTLAKQLEVPETSAPLPNGTPEESEGIFNLLPRPGSKWAVLEEDDEFLHKKEEAPNVPKPKAKITVPSLSDFKDIDDRPATQPKTTNGKKSGLLSMLPQPKNSVTATTRSLIPNILTQKPTATAKKKEPLPSPMKKAKTSKPLLSSYSDESDNDEVETDFFSINKPVELPDVPMEDQEGNVTENVVERRGIESYFKQVPNESETENGESEMGEGYSNEVEASSYSNGAEGSSEAVLDEEAIMKLCGTRGKRKREDIQIVDVNQQEVLADARAWLLKGLLDDTSTRVSASRKKGNEPTSQQRRKHQITYLAHQAKANESELQNQWANSRMSRRQTQSKYGF